jgi:ankyrin repeat protein
MMETTSAVRQALYRGDRAEAERLAAGAELDVFDAAALGDTEALRGALTRDSDAVGAWSDDGFTALHLAAYFAGSECVRVLVDAGADVGAVARNEMRVQPLHSAAAHGDVDACRILLDAGADPSARQQGDYTPLDEAVLTKNEALAALLRERGGVQSGRQLPT